MPVHNAQNDDLGEVIGLAPAFPPVSPAPASVTVDAAPRYLGECFLPLASGYPATFAI